MPGAESNCMDIDTIKEGIIPASLLRLAAVEWPDSKWPWWIQYSDSNSTKRASRGLDGIPRSCLRVLDKMAEFNIGRLLGDSSKAFPDLSLYGAGLHEIPPQGHLGRHLDASHHPILGWKRVASMVLCVNERWESDWGGELDAGGLLRLPSFGRMFLLETNDTAWHAVRTVTGPEHRRTLAMFWWSLSADQDSVKRDRHTFQ